MVAIGTSIAHTILELQNVGQRKNDPAREIEVLTETISATKAYYAPESYDLTVTSLTSDDPSSSNSYFHDLGMWPANVSDSIGNTGQQKEVPIQQIGTRFQLIFYQIRRREIQPIVPDKPVHMHSLANAGVRKLAFSGRMRPDCFFGAAGSINA